MWGLRGELKARGGVDVVTSSTTSNAEIARNPHAPYGFRAAWGHLLRWRSSTMAAIACVAQPRICPTAPGTRPLLILGQAPPVPRIDLSSTSSTSIASFLTGGNRSIIERPNCSGT